MAQTENLLIELGTEELPPRSLKKLMTSFASAFGEELDTKGLTYESITPFATPRRLALKVTGLITHQNDKQIERRGPALKAAHDADGNPTKAAEGFARSCGVSVADLQSLETEKGSWLIHRSLEPGQSTASLIPKIINPALRKLPIPKPMKWGAHKIAFVRPVHWLIVLYGKDIIDCEILGNRSGNTSRGHRFHSPEAFVVDCPNTYEAQLEQNNVIACFSKRQALVRGKVLAICENVEGEPLLDDGLLEEVTGLVEWPVPLIGEFEPEFLEVPQEALISAMQEHQKYFPMLDNDGKLLPGFVTVSNIESKDKLKVISGNERVIRPRLADARFFFETDKKKSLEQHSESLKKVVFESGLGSMYDKSKRISQLAEFIARKTSGNPKWAKRAGALCKADLCTEMVGEFPDLQGIMGRYYAQFEGEPIEVAQSLDEQYKPRFAGDSIPSTLTGASLAIADKVDTLVGILGVGKHPTGDKDPYALRRAALGVLRIIIGKELPLDLIELLNFSVSLYNGQLTNEKLGSEFLDFMQGRYMAWFQEEGVSTDIINSVLALSPSAPFDFYNRVQAVKAFKELPEARALAAAYKRVSNILLKRKDISPVPDFDESLFSQPEENTLAIILTDKHKEIFLAQEKDYTKMLSSLSELKDPVDQFFDNVMVNVEEKKVRDNRIALLQRLHELFVEIADISYLQ